MSTASHRVMTGYSVKQIRGCLGCYWYNMLFPFTEKAWRALSKSIPMPDPPFEPMEEKTIWEMTVRQHKAEVGKSAHEVNWA